ncbi:MAG: hypothetical protein AABZ06_08285 [Bdellovibrionota bacterium]
MNKLRVPVVVVVIAAVGGAFYFFYLKRLTDAAISNDSTSLISAGTIPAKSFRPAPSIKNKNIIKSTNDTIRSVDNAWEVFQSRFGPGLEPQFLKNGALASIHSKLAMAVDDKTDTAAKNGVPGFSTLDISKIETRAAQIIESIKPLLMVENDWLLEKVSTKSGPVSAQVFFRQSRNGVPLAPYGNISINLGKNGELISVYSDYLPFVRVNPSGERLTTEQAGVKALTALPDLKPATPEGGSLVLWASKPDMGRTVDAKYAYEFYVAGRQVVVDASDGSVLHVRDRRQF